MAPRDKSTRHPDHSLSRESTTPQMEETEFLSVDDCRSRLPFRISERQLRRLLRASGLVVEHRWQLALPVRNWPDFVRFMTCRSTSGPRSSRSTAKTGASGFRGARSRSSAKTARSSEKEISSARAQIRALCARNDRLNAELEAAAGAGPLERTFEEAVVIYLGAGGDKRFLGEEEGKPRNKLLDFLGQYRVNEIDDAVMAKAVAKLYPTATPATVNRQLFTPVISVLRMACKGKAWKPEPHTTQGARRHQAGAAAGG